MDISQFFNIAVNGIPLLFVVLGLVEWLKRLGVTGRALLVSSLIIGLLLGGGYQLSQSIPVDFGGWFAVVIYGLAMGLVASGVYDVLRRSSAAGVVDVVEVDMIVDEAQTPPVQ